MRVEIGEEEAVEEGKTRLGARILQHIPYTNTLIPITPSSVMKGIYQFSLDLGEPNFHRRVAIITRNAQTRDTLFGWMARMAPFGGSGLVLHGGDFLKQSILEFSHHFLHYVAREPRWQLHRKNGRVAATNICFEHSQLTVPIVTRPSTQEVGGPSEFGGVGLHRTFM
jgi:hypothetical protein